MLVQQMAGNWLHLSIELNGFEGHFSDDFQRKRILDRFLPAWPPYEWPVTVHEHSTHLRRIEIFESFNNDVRGLQFVGGLDFLSSHCPRHRHLTVEVIGVRGAETGNPPAGLRECDRIARVSMNNRADAFKGLEEPAVGGRIGGGPQGALNDFSFEIHHNYVLSLHYVVFHA